MPFENSTDPQIKAIMLFTAMQLNKILCRENRKIINKPKCQITLKQKPWIFILDFSQKLLSRRKEGENEQEKERMLRNTENKVRLKFYREMRIWYPPKLALFQIVFLQD